MKRKLVSWFKENCFPIHESYIMIWSLGVFIGTMLGSQPTSSDLTWVSFAADMVSFAFFGIPMLILSFYAIRAVTEKVFDIKSDDVAFIQMDGKQFDFKDNEVEN